MLAVSFFGCAGAFGTTGVSGASAEVCPVRAQSPLQYVDVFDGAPSDLATLIPDDAGERKGHWALGYVYDAGRYVTVRCKYADGQTKDVRLAGRVNRCDYRIDDKKTLKVMCK
ncbi:lipoprotein, putative [Burkholderia humptydooensis MSMB43]|uniref:Lipoprotein, putative n=1 Tax=Burkholderia humptydooensis MSMB43 TaxID=441157 RepID=A0ABN0GB81_9BURK|nr:lipoprotein, putative [Burkholderia humptydooensis MSMB43]